jgi:hypothetical protein
MEEQIQQSWWKRNWKWVVPTGGCLTIIIIVIAFLSYGVYQFTDKLSEETSVFAFIGIIQKVQKSVEVREALGSPIRFDGLQDEGYDPEDSNKLNLNFEIQGAQSDGQLRVIADKTEDGWSYTTFTVTVEETGEIIDLKDPANE